MTPFLAVFAPLLLAYALPLWWCWELWSLPEGYFAHGPLVPLVTAFVFVSRRKQWSQIPARTDWNGLWLLGPALVMHLAGAALTIDSVSAASLVFAVPGAAWLAVGRERLRGSWPALWMVAFAVPLPIYVTDRLAFELKEVAVRGGVWLAQATGLAIRSEGASLYVPGQETPLDVADPCGGLRSLLAMVTLVYCIAFFVGPQTTLRRAVLLVAAAPTAVLVNLLRICAICWLAYFEGVPFATGTGHDVLNGLAWVLDIGIVLGLDALASRARPAAPAPGPVAPAPAGGTSLRPGLLLWPFAVLCLALQLTKPAPTISGRAAALPVAAGPYVQKAQYEMTRRMFQLLGTDDATWRCYETRDQHEIYVVGVFHGSNWKSVHPPHICLLGSDMDIVSEDATELASGADDQAGRIVLKTRRDGRTYVSLYAYGARDLCTGSYLQFFLHHAPRALFRASNDGFLLRVETYVANGEGLLDAQARCEGLLAALVTQARGLLP